MIKHWNFESFYQERRLQSESELILQSSCDLPDNA